VRIMITLFLMCGMQLEATRRLSAERATDSRTGGSEIFPLVK
jgi:hypothetical protein